VAKKKAAKKAAKEGREEGAQEEGEEGEEVTAAWGATHGALSRASSALLDYDEKGTPSTGWAFLFSWDRRTRASSRKGLFYNDLWLRIRIGRGDSPRYARLASVGDLVSPGWTESLPWPAAAIQRAKQSFMPCSNPPAARCSAVDYPRRGARFPRVIATHDLVHQRAGRSECATSMPRADCKCGE